MKVFFTVIVCFLMAVVPANHVSAGISNNNLIEITAKAKNGNITAIRELGDMYKEGRGVPQNYKEAIKWYRLAANQNDGSALDCLGEMYLRGYGVQKNLKEAVRYYELSSHQYKKEIDSIKDRELVSYNLKTLSVQQSNIGIMYYSGGNGLAKDNVKAHAWFSLSAANGDVKAKEYMKILAGKMDQYQIEKAQKLASELWAK